MSCYDKSANHSNLLIRSLLWVFLIGMQEGSSSLSPLQVDVGGANASFFNSKHGIEIPQ